MRIPKERLLIMRLQGRLQKNWPRLEWLREATDAEVVEMLRQISGEDFGFDVRAWARWWNTKRRDVS